MLAACSTSDGTVNGTAGASGASGTSGSSGTSGTSGAAGAAGAATASAVCAELAQYSVELGCLNASEAQAALIDCMAHAATASAPCEEQLSAFFTCMLAQPASAFECSASGMGALQSANNACGAEASALAACNAGAVDGG